MARLYKPQCLLLYLLVFIVFFFLGAIIAGVTGAAKGQGLAGGAIVLFYGLVSAAIALILAMVFCSRAELSQVVRANKILGLLTVLFIGFFTVKFMLRADKNKPEEIKRNLVPKQAIEPTPELAPIAIQAPSQMGLGFFKPRFSDKSS